MTSATSLVIANYLRIAAEDLKGSRALLRLGNRNAAYLAEQAAEKLIRAVLTSEGRHGGVKHQLDTMVALIPDENPMKTPLQEIEELTVYATTYRYPTPGGRIPTAPTEATLTEFLSTVETILTQLAARFGVDLTRDGLPASTPDPIR